MSHIANLPFSSGGKYWAMKASVRWSPCSMVLRASFPCLVSSPYFRESWNLSPPYFKTACTISAVGLAFIATYAFVSSKTWTGHHQKPFQNFQNTIKKLLQMKWIFQNVCHDSKQNFSFGTHCGSVRDTLTVSLLYSNLNYQLLNTTSQKFIVSLHARRKNHFAIMFTKPLCFYWHLKV